MNWFSDLFLLCGLIWERRGRFFQPRNVKSAAERIIADVPPSDRRKMAAMPERHLHAYHMTLGMDIRARFNLWGGYCRKLFNRIWLPRTIHLIRHNWPLMLSCARQTDGDVLVPDDASFVIIKAIWKTLREEPNRTSGATENTAGRDDKKTWLTRRSMAVLERTQNDVIREGAAAHLGRSGSADALDALCDAAASGSTVVKVVALKALGRAGYRRSLPVVMNALADPDDVVRAQALSTLSNIGDPTTFDAINGRLRDDSDLVRSEALQALCCLTDGRIFEPILSVFRRPGDFSFVDYIELHYAMMRLALSHPDTVSRLVACLDDDDPIFLYNIVESLRLVEDYSVVDSLVGLFERVIDSLPDGGTINKDTITLLECITETLYQFNDPRYEELKSRIPILEEEDIIPDDLDDLLKTDLKIIE
jgi:hypothetical protein